MNYNFFIYELKLAKSIKIIFRINKIKKKYLFENII